MFPTVLPFLAELMFNAEVEEYPPPDKEAKVSS